MRCRCGQDKETHNKDRCKNDEGEFIEDYKCKYCNHYFTSHDENLGCHKIINAHPTDKE